MCLSSGFDLSFSFPYMSRMSSRWYFLNFWKFREEVIFLLVKLGSFVGCDWDKSDFSRLFAIISDWLDL